jgi:hypothetical protein
MTKNVNTEDFDAAAQQLQAARSELKAATAEASVSALRARDMEYLRAAGILASTDEGVKEASEQDAAARHALAVARQKERDARGQIELATRRNEDEAKRLELERRTTLVRRDFPEVAAELDAAENALEQLVGSSTLDAQAGIRPAHIPGRLLHAAKERASSARSAFEAALQQGADEVSHVEES